MEVSVRDIMLMGPLQEAKIVAGKNGIDLIVKGITIIEAPDIVEWLTGGEVLLTSLYNVQSEVSSYYDYIRRMANKGVSALIIKTGRVVEQIPLEIIEAGNEYNLPIIELGKEIKYIDVMYPIMSSLFNHQVSKLQYYKEVQDRLTELVIAGEGMEGIIRVLKELIGNPIVVYDRKFQVLATTDESVVKFGEVEDHSRRENLNNKIYFYRQEVLLPDLDNLTATQVVIPIQQLNQINAYLVVVEMNQKIKEIEYILLENASTVISLELVKRFAIGEVELKFKYDLLDTITAGNFHLETIQERASLMGWELRDPYCVVLIEFQEINEYIKDRKYRNSFISEIGGTVSHVINEYTKHFMRIRSDSLYVLWPVKGRSEEKVLQDIKKAAQKLAVIFKNRYKKMRMFTGVGSIAPSISEVADSYQEAQNAIHFAKNMDEEFISFSELGVMRLLCKFAENNDLEEFIPKSIQCLLAFDRDNNSNLLHTLEVFLKTNSNATQTAKELFVHYKTVLYRLEKIKEVSGINLANNKERLEAELGLKIVSLLKNRN